ncbi:MAG: hypothetical protein CSB21_01635 [Deltaproteobacteria bacterium]|nr:MAG: hypothetical protein CSB21_01635 [Deltaproteobacteria bacterium]
MRTNVFITIDTETSIGGHFSNPLLKPVGSKKRIYGEVSGKSYGIPLIIKIADSYDVRLTFFVEVLNHYYFGKEEMYNVCDYIMKKGHDVQLHLHPNYLNFKLEDSSSLKFSDNMSAYDVDTQSEIIKEGKALLIEYGVKNPIAFRAGNYGFNIDTLKALSKNNLLYDSSYNAAFLSPNNSVSKIFINDVKKIENVFEFPITNFNQKVFNTKKTRPLDINGAGFEEIRKTLEWSSKNQIKNITVIMHSFSFFKALDVQYNRCRVMKKIIARFEKLCRFLNENRDKYNSIFFNEIDIESLSGIDYNKIFRMPFFPTAKRMLEQIMTR